jgi:hypothetical protein
VPAALWTAGVRSRRARAGLGDLLLLAVLVAELVVVSSSIGLASGSSSASAVAPRQRYGPAARAQSGRGTRALALDRAPAALVRSGKAVLAGDQRVPLASSGGRRRAESPHVKRGPSFGARLGRALKAPMTRKRRRNAADGRLQRGAVPPLWQLTEQRLRLRGSTSATVRVAVGWTTSSVSGARPRA